MATTAETESRRHVFSLPNQLTVSRLALAVVLFALLAWRQYLPSLLVFLLAVTTDWLDGYFARKYGMITTLGRILDPFVDKVIICGTFVFLVAIPESRIAAWMAVVVFSRELLITALRSFLEQRGADFSATFSGKIKMVLQCISAGASLTYLWLNSQAPLPPYLGQLVLVLAWAAVLMTVYSGAAYVRAAIKLLRN